jgi:plastocyanin
VTSTQGLFASPGLDSGDNFSYRFTTPGTYPYFCALHPHMKGTIIVQ